MVEEKKSKIPYKRIVVIIIIALIVLKSYQHFKRRDLISIIGEEYLFNLEEVKIHRWGGVYSASYDYNIEDKGDIEGLIKLIKSIRVRRYFIGNGVIYDGNIDNVSFNNGESIVRIEIIGEGYIMLDIFPDDASYRNYKIIGDIDTSTIDRIIDKKSLQNISGDKSHLIDIYELDENAYMDYILSDKIHMYKKLLSKRVSDEGTELIMNHVSDPIDHEGKFRDRIKEQEIEITSDRITIDDMVVLKTPLKEGNTWDTNVELAMDGASKTHKATVSIQEVTDKTVTTRLVVPNLEGYKDKEYVKIQKYQKNFGLIYESYNDQYGLIHEIKLEKVYRNDMHEFIDPREFMKYNDLETIEGDF